MKSLDITIVELILAKKLIPSQTSKVRGFFAQQFSQYNLFHNHVGGSYIQRYPLIQYKITPDGDVILYGLEQGAQLLRQLFLQLPPAIMLQKAHSTEMQSIPITQTRLTRETELFGPTQEVHRYRFASPWISPLHKDRIYAAYLQKSKAERKLFMNRALANNLVTAAKGVNFFVKARIIADCSRVSPLKVSPRFKNLTTLRAYNGVVTVNFLLPDMMGVGKSSAFGFGQVQRLS